MARFDPAVGVRNEQRLVAGAGAALVPGGNPFGPLR
jgi:hypothetical protein